MSIEDNVDNFLKEENPQAEAVKSLISVKKKEKGEIGSDIELKTDLNDSQVCIHTSADLVNEVLNMDRETFAEKCILGDLVALKERKLLSKDRKSRQEIVDIAKRPDETSDQRRQENFVKRLFTPRQQGGM